MTDDEGEIDDSTMAERPERPSFDNPAYNPAYNPNFKN